MQVYSFNIRCRYNGYNIGVGRFRILGAPRLRILGGQGLEYWGARGVANTQQALNIVLTSMRCKDVASTSFRRHVPTRFLINQCFSS